MLFDNLSGPVRGGVEIGAGGVTEGMPCPLGVTARDGVKWG